MSIINISPQNISGTCVEKCSFSFNYLNSYSTATNYGSYIQLTYDQSSNPPVTFNNSKYNVESISIFSPSLHNYNNSQIDSEILITHQPVNGGKTLIICVPVSQNGTTVNASQIITQIINSVSKSAPSIGQNTNNGISEFTLNNIIPMKPFYYYTTPNTDYIAYDVTNSIGINTTTLQKLKSIIQPMESNPMTGNFMLFINQKGPSSGLGNDIYIDCQPTDSIDEDVVVNKQSDFDLGNITTNPLFIFIISVVGFIVFIVLIYWLIKYFTGDDVTNSNSNSKSLFSSFKL